MIFISGFGFGFAVAVLFLGSIKGKTPINKILDSVVERPKFKAKVPRQDHQEILQDLF